MNSDVELSEFELPEGTTSRAGDYLAMFVFLDVVLRRTKY